MRSSTRRSPLPCKGEFSLRLRLRQRLRRVRAPLLPLPCSAPLRAAPLLTPRCAASAPRARTLTPQGVGNVDAAVAEICNPPPLVDPEQRTCRRRVSVHVPRKPPAAAAAAAGGSPAGRSPEQEELERRSRDAEARLDDAEEEAAAAEAATGAAAAPLLAAPRPGALLWAVGATAPEEADGWGLLSAAPAQFIDAGGDRRHHAQGRQSASFDAGGSGGGGGGVRLCRAGAVSCSAPAPTAAAATALGPLPTAVSIVPPLPSFFRGTLSTSSSSGGSGGGCGGPDDPLSAISDQPSRARASRSSTGGRLTRHSTDGVVGMRPTPPSPLRPPLRGPRRWSWGPNPPAAPPSSPAARSTQQQHPGALLKQPPFASPRSSASSASSAAGGRCPTLPCVGGFCPPSLLAPRTPSERSRASTPRRRRVSWGAGSSPSTSRRSSLQGAPAGGDGSSYFRGAFAPAAGGAAEELLRSGLPALDAIVSVRRAGLHSREGGAAGGGRNQLRVERGAPNQQLSPLLQVDSDGGADDGLPPPRAAAAAGLRPAGRAATVSLF